MGKSAGDVLTQVAHSEADKEMAPMAALIEQCEVPLKVVVMDAITAQADTVQHKMR